MGKTLWSLKWEFWDDLLGLLELVLNSMMHVRKRGRRALHYLRMLKMLQ